MGTNNIKLNLIDVGFTGDMNNQWKKELDKMGYILSFNPLYNSFNTTNHCHLRLAISDEEGITDFNVLKKQDCSSFFEVEDTAASMRPQSPTDLDIKQVIKVNRIRLDTILDSMEPHFNFLKVDTQGYDLKVIKSLGKYLNTIWCIQVEVFFAPFYKDAPLVDEVCKYIVTNGTFRFLGNARKPNSSFGDFVFINEFAPREFMDIVGRIYKCEALLA